MGEGAAVNYATAKEMGEPTARHYAERQETLIAILLDLSAAAYRRFCVHQGQEWPGQPALQLRATAPEVARADNESLAAAARDIVQALTQMRANGWIDDETAATLALKFAGEPLGREEIAHILAAAAHPVIASEAKQSPSQAGAYHSGPQGDRHFR
jgi:hypothetical protein